MKIFTCKVCGVEFRREGRNPKGIFCSIKCKAKYQHKFLSGKNSPCWRRDFIREKICKYCEKRFSNNINSSSTGFQKAKFCSKHCADIGGFRHKGKSNNKWRGGIKSELDKLRNSPMHKKWSKEVMIRDNFTCLICKKRGGNLHSHHIKSFTNSL